MERPKAKVLSFSSVQETESHYYSCTASPARLTPGNQRVRCLRIGTE